MNCQNAELRVAHCTENHPTIENCDNTPYNRVKTSDGLEILENCNILELVFHRRKQNIQTTKYKSQ